MTLKEAIESGKNFRQPNSYWLTGSPAVNFQFTVQQIIATDWEIEEPTITITKSYYLELMVEAIRESHVKNSMPGRYDLIECSARLLLVDKLFGEH